MTENNIPVKSAQEEIDILYNLKTLVREYRRYPDISLISEILKYYALAAEIAATDTADLKKTFDYLTAGLKKEIISALNVSGTLKKWEQNKDFPGLIEPETLNSINKKISDAETIHTKASQIQKEIKALENGDGTSGKKTVTPRSKTTKAAEDSDLVKQLKAEAIAAIEKNKIWSDEEKKIQIEKVNTAAALKVKVKGSKCSIIYDAAAEPAETSLAINGVILEGKFSRHAKIEKASLSELSKISSSGKEFKTAAGLAQKSQADSQKRAVKKSEQETEQRRIKREALQNQLNSLNQSYADSKKAVGESVIAMIQNLDGDKLFHSLTDNPPQRKDLFLYLTKQKDVTELLSKTPETLVDAAMWDKKVWKLYMEDEKKAQSASYYDTCLAKARPFPEVYKNVCAFMENDSIDEKKCNIAVIKIAGTQLPKEAAENLFLKAVFHYGMALTHGDEFTPQKFEKMNQVLGLYGYKINLKAISVENEPSKGAMALSKQILDDMHAKGPKAEKNRTIALMYKLGRFQEEHPNQNLQQIATTPELRSLYSDFAEIFFKEKSTQNRPVPVTKYEAQWNSFVNDRNNQTDVKRLYDYFNKEARNDGELAKWTDNLSAGVSIIEEGSLREQSNHHIFDRKYAGLFPDGREILNYSDNLAPAICMHPSDNDPHKDAHKFDMREIYLYQRNGRYITSSFNNIRPGDVFYYPEVLKKNSAGKFVPVIEYDTLLVSSQGSIREPNVPGRPRNMIQKSIEVLKAPEKNKTISSGRKADGFGSYYIPVQRI